MLKHTLITNCIDWKRDVDLPTEIVFARPSKAAGGRWEWAATIGPLSVWGTRGKWILFGEEDDLKFVSLRDALEVAGDCIRCGVFSMNPQPYQTREDYEDERANNMISSGE